MQKIISFIFAVFLLGSLCSGFVGCNTMQGIGQDVESAGEAIEEEASD